MCSLLSLCQRVSNTSSGPMLSFILHNTSVYLNSVCVFTRRKKTHRVMPDPATILTELIILSEAQLSDWWLPAPKCHQVMCSGANADLDGLGVYFKGFICNRYLTMPSYWLWKQPVVTNLWMFQSNYSTTGLCAPSVATLLRCNF